MRLASIRIPGRLPGWTIGVVSGAGGAVALMPPGFGSLDAVIRDWRVARHEIQASLPSAPLVPMTEVEFGPPLRRFNRDILCADFTKGPGAVVGPCDEIGLDRQISESWDAEAGVAIIMGKAGRSIPAQDALSHVFGYCIACSVTPLGLRSKSVDGTLPLGPWITTADLVGEPQALTIECVVNDDVVQEGPPARDVAELIAELSRGVTLQPGDVVLAAGVREAESLVRLGDEVVTRVTGLGELRNRAGAVELADHVAAAYAAAR